MIIKNTPEKFTEITHKVDLCVVGGGIAGICAAVSAARDGAKVLLMQERPVLGGNASSEIRMWIRGAHGKYNKESGLIEELALENAFRNPSMNFSIWDSILYEKVILEENIKLLLNCSCCDLTMSGNKIKSVRGWQMTTQSWHTVEAGIFADCSGDSVLAPLSGAEYRIGRESREEFCEEAAPLESDNMTMGMSCLFQVREQEKPTLPFVAPAWANKYTKDDFPYRMNIGSENWKYNNFWWIEIGGTGDTIGDTEELRAELLKISFGVWDFIKNSGEMPAANWELEWMGFLPGKRESRRYVGDYILTQNDILNSGDFEDIIAFGGWTIDDHDPLGFQTKNPPNIHHPAPSPFGIPYRCLYSKNIDNLMFAGRNISATHSAMSACRVMATCGTLGQALGFAASIAVREKISPREVYMHKLHELQETLMQEDCRLPTKIRSKSRIMEKADICAPGVPQILFNGLDRPTEKDDNVWEGEIGSEIIIEFCERVSINKIRIIFDSDLSRETWDGIDEYAKTFPMKHNIRLGEKPLEVPCTLIKDLDVFVDNGKGQWELLQKVENNHQRLLRLNIKVDASKLKIVPKASNGCKTARIHSVYID